MTRLVRYSIVSPVRDEELYLEQTIRSLLSQTICPTEWVIVNDGSIDKTGEIIEKYGKQCSWIKAVHRSDRGFRKAGGGVIDAFYSGYNELRVKDWDFIVKLDGDVSFISDYFARCFRHFEHDTKLGIGGGDIYNLLNGRAVLENNPSFHVRGATKIYRRECWEAIGGLVAVPGWDTLDEVKANMLGWQTRSFPELRVIHHRYTGGADGDWRNSRKNGVGSYICGYHPVFMTVKCIKRLFEKPYGIGSLGLLWGYASGYCKRLPQIEDKPLIRYIRREQINRLLFRKSIWY